MTKKHAEHEAGKRTELICPKCKNDTCRTLEPYHDTVRCPGCGYQDYDICFYVET